MEQKFNGKFRYNGEDLKLMKLMALTDDPHVAVETFIERAIDELKDPNDFLKEAREAYDGRKA